MLDDSKINQLDMVTSALCSSLVCRLTLFGTFRLLSSDLDADNSVPLATVKGTAINQDGRYAISTARVAVKPPAIDSGMKEILICTKPT